jgi:hypothetical protein
MLVMVVGLMVLGCGGGDFDIKVSRPAGEHPRLGETMPTGPVRLPGDQPLNIVVFNSGQSGHADGQAVAESTGRASADARVEKHGEAWGEFQLGYYFKHAGAEPLDAVLRLKVDCTGAVEARRAATASDESIAAVESTRDEMFSKSMISFFVKDTNGSTLHRESLMNLMTRDGPRDWSGSQELALETRFEPGLAYYLVVAGRVDAATGGDQAASAAVEIRRCDLVIDWRAASSAKTAMTRDAGATSVP